MTASTTRDAEAPIDPAFPEGSCMRMGLIGSVFGRFGRFADDCSASTGVARRRVTTKRVIR